MLPLATDPGQKLELKKYSWESTYMLFRLGVFVVLFWFLRKMVKSSQILYFCMLLTKELFNPNSIRSYKIVQKLSPKQAARGVAQSPYPTYRHGKACLSKQPPWRAAGDPRLACGRSRVRAPGPAGALRALFFSTLPSFLLQFFSHLPHQTCETCG